MRTVTFHPGMSGFVVVAVLAAILIVSTCLALSEDVTLSAEQRQLFETHFRVANCTDYRLEIRPLAGEPVTLLPDEIATLRWVKPKNFKGTESEHAVGLALAIVTTNPEESVRIIDADTGELRVWFYPVSPGVLFIVGEDALGKFRVIPHSKVPRKEAFFATPRQVYFYLNSDSIQRRVAHRSGVYEKQAARKEPIKKYPRTALKEPEVVKPVPAPSERAVKKRGGGKEYFFITNFADHDVEMFSTVEDTVIPVNGTLEMHYPYAREVAAYNKRKTKFKPFEGYFVSPGLKAPITGKVGFLPETHYVYQVNPDGLREIVQLPRIDYPLPDQPAYVDEGTPVWREPTAPDWFMSKGDRGEYTSLNPILWEMMRKIQYDHRQKATWVARNHRDKRVWFAGEVLSVSRGGVAKIKADKMYIVYLDTRGKIDSLDTSFRKGAKVRCYGTLAGGPRPEDVTAPQVMQVVMDRCETATD